VVALGQRRHAGADLDDDARAAWGNLAAPGSTGVTFATRRAADWRVWRRLGAPIAFGAVAIGAAFGLDQGWAKIVFVVGITLPVPLIGALLRRKRGALT
jgi:hypothetical protein